jgi:hypothetical protein
MKFNRMVRHSSAIIALGVCLASAAAQVSGNQASLDALRAACSDDAARLCAGLPSKSSTTPSQPTSSPSSSVSTAPGAPANSPTHAGPVIGQPTKVAGEEFVRRVIPDPARVNMAAATIRLPEKWTLDSKVEWHYDWVENPLIFGAHAVNPDNSEAFYLYPLLRLESIEVAPQYRQYLHGKQQQPGERMSTGAINMPLQPPVQALAMFIKQTRPDVTNFKWIGQQDLPGLAQALRLTPWPNDHGVAIKIGYELNGQAVEEAFFGVYYYSQGGNEDTSVGQLHGRKHDQADQLGIPRSAELPRPCRHTRQAHARLLPDRQVIGLQPPMGAVEPRHPRPDARRLQPEAPAGLRSDSRPAGGRGADAGAGTRLRCQFRKAGTRPALRRLRR